MPISIRDVANRAGVSVATVSKVLNDAVGAQIAPATRERVRHAAASLGYRPSPIARAMLRKQMDTVGVILPPGTGSPLRSNFFAGLLDGILQAAAHHKQHTMLFTGEDWMDAEKSLPAYRDGRCDGFLMLYQPDLSGIVPALLDADVPLVLLNETFDDPRLSIVDVDNVTGGRTATEYLLSLGHRRIGMVYGTYFFDFARTRCAGYRAAMDSAGIAVDPDWVPGDFHDHDLWGNAARQVERLMSLPPDRRPTALFCVNDDAATRTLQVLSQRNLRIPEDVSVIGFNDDTMAARQLPPLTTLRQPYEGLGEAAVSLLLEQVRRVEARGKRVLLSAEVIERASTAPPPE